jgi:hypothetical protein
VDTELVREPARGAEIFMRERQADRRQAV